VPAGEIDACVSVLAGPFTRGGAPIASAPERPYLTVLPGVSIDTALLLTMKLRSLAGDHSYAETWKGSAHEGWLVVPLLGWAPPEGSLAEAASALARLARAVTDNPRPQPVLLDLAGLETCPSREQLAGIISLAESWGIRPFGYLAAGEQVHQQGGDLMQRDSHVGLVLSFRVGATGPCSTLPQVAGKALSEAILSQMESYALFDPERVTVLLHWQGSVLSPGEKADLVKEALASGVSLVVGFERAAAHGLLAANRGLGLVNAGAFLGGDFLLPSPYQPSGLLVQCTEVAASRRTCRLLPVALSLGEGAPVTGPECASCKLLPRDYFESVWGELSCR
jgi:hypothetical protein